MFFTEPALRALVSDWEARAKALTSQFRAVVGRHSDDQRLAALVRDLGETSAEFRDWWADYEVGGFTDPDHTINHPTVGTIRFDLTQTIRIHGTRPGVGGRSGPECPA